MNRKDTKRTLKLFIAQEGECYNIPCYICPVRSTCKALNLEGSLTVEKLLEKAKQLLADIVVDEELRR